MDSQRLAHLLMHLIRTDLERRELVEFEVVNTGQATPDGDNPHFVVRDHLSGRKYLIQVTEV